MAALDLLGRRWTLRILWELREGPLTFRALREATGNVSPTVLNTRLAELREAGILENTDEGYAGTKLGVELEAVLIPLSKWADRWEKRR